MEGKSSKSEQTSFSQINHSLSNTNTNKQEREVEEIPVLLRRLDSFAWLIQGDNVCSAAYFDGQALFLATNQRAIKTRFTSIKRFLKDITIESQEIINRTGKFNKIKEEEKYETILVSMINQISDLLKTLEKKVYLLGDEEYLSNFIRSLFKITLSTVEGCVGKDAFKCIVELSKSKAFQAKVNQIAVKLSDEVQNNYASYKKGSTRSNEVKLEMIKIIKDRFNDISDWFLPHLDTEQERNFPEKLITALQKNGVYYVENNNIKTRNNRTDLHAELILVQQILYDEGILNSKGRISSEVAKELTQQYIGISKKCCLNCECAINAVNNVLMQHGRTDKLIDMRTTNGSAGEFPAEIPDFLVECQAFQKEFLKLRGCSSLKTAFSQKKRSSADEQNQRGSKSAKGSKTNRAKAVELTDEELQKHSGVPYEEDPSASVLANNLSKEVFRGQNSQAPNLEQDDASEMETSDVDASAGNTQPSQ